MLFRSNAYGYSVDGMMKSLKSMWPENEVREREKLENEMEIEVENPEKKNKKIKAVEEKTKEEEKERVVIHTEMATVTVAKAKKMPIVARAPEVTSREATFCRDLPRVDELIDWGFYLDFHALMDYLPTEPPVNLRNPNIVIQILKKKNPDWHCMFVGMDTYWMRTKEITKIVHLDKFQEGLDFFKSGDAALAYIHGQLNAYGHIDFKDFIIPSTLYPYAFNWPWI